MWSGKDGVGAKSLRSEVDCAVCVVGRAERAEAERVRLGTGEGSGGGGTEGGGTSVG